LQLDALWTILGEIDVGLYRLGAIALALVLGSRPGAINYPTVGLGRLGGRVLTMWVGEDDFVYAPTPGAVLFRNV
jgi:hypothetical protein